MNTPDTEEEVIDEPLHISAEALFECSMRTQRLLTQNTTDTLERVKEQVMKLGNSRNSAGFLECKARVIKILNSQKNTPSEDSV